MIGPQDSRKHYLARFTENSGADDCIDFGGTGFYNEQTTQRKKIGTRPKQVNADL
jgi:hypothetical protein